MQYNVRKMQILYTIKCLSDCGIHPTRSTIAKAIEINPNVVSRYLTLYYDSKYINRSRKRGVKGMVCSLTKKGYRMLGRYLERHMKGEHLNLKWKGYPVKEHDFYLLLRTEEVIKNELCTESIQ